MIDPSKITNFNRTKEELEELILFCIIVAGKKATIQAKKLDLFLNSRPPFELIRSYIKDNILLEKIQEHKLGQFNKINKAFSQIIELDVFKCTVSELESITGIGPKTARFYLLHSRPKQRIAVLDTHILKWLRHELKVNTPKSTPSSKRYLDLEKVFLSHCDDNHLDPATLDLEIWNRYSQKLVNFSD